MTADPATRADLDRLYELPADQCRETLIDWLLGNSKRRSAVAAEVFNRVGRPSVAILLGAAFAPRRSRGHRVRLLEALGDLGQPLDVNQWFQLGSMGWFGPEVGAKAAQVLSRLGHAV
jgi:hypothetical protein